MDIKMKEALFAGMFIIIGAIISPLVTVLLSSSNMPPVIVDFSSDLVSPQPKNTSITWVANARDPNNDLIYYKFQLKGHSTGNSWDDEQDWSQRNSWTWHAIGSDIGNNTIRVLVRDNKHVMTDIGDDEKSDTYTITKSSRDWVNEAIILNNQGKYNESIQAYDSAIQIDPQDATVWDWKGNALFDQEKYDEAIQAYDRGLQINPQNATVWDYKGSALLNQRKYDEAIQAYDRSIQINPQYVEARYNKGRAFFMLGKYDEAIQAFDEAIQINPQYNPAWDYKGNALYHQGKYDEAIQAYDRSIQINPQDATVWDWKGNALLGQSKYDEAINAYNRAIEINPQYAETLKDNLATAWNSKGHALIVRNTFVDTYAAIQAFDKAIEIDPQYAIAWQNKGEALMRLYRNAEANDTFAKAKELGYKG